MRSFDLCLWPGKTIRIDSEGRSTRNGVESLSVALRRQSKGFAFCQWFRLRVDRFIPYLLTGEHRSIVIYRRCSLSVDTVSIPTVLVGNRRDPALYHVSLQPNFYVRLGHTYLGHTYQTIVFGETKNHVWGRLVSVFVSPNFCVWLGHA